MKRSDYLAATGVLLVTRAPPTPAPAAPGQPAAVPANPAEGDELLLACWADGRVTGLHGHVDLGTGLRTALAQIVAEELDAPLAQVTMVMGDTSSAPNQGATIASASIQIHAEPLRQAAALAAAWLRSNGGAASLHGTRVLLKLEAPVATKSPADYTLVGSSPPRVDIPAKVRGELVFVHDMRLPGMLHGRVVRPPYAGVDAGEFVGNSLLAIDDASITHIEGIVAVVHLRDFVGVVAMREDQAEAAMLALRVEWRETPRLPPLQDLAQALRDNPSTRRVLVDHGDVDATLASAPVVLQQDYVWPYQMHASIGPSCALADWQGTSLKVWAGTQNPHVLRADLARLTGLADTAIDVIRMEAAGCYGRNGADDVAADAALLSRAVGKPVRVQLTREQEHAWEPKGAAQLMQVRGALDAKGALAAYDFQTSYPSNGAPTLALLLTRKIEPLAQAYEMGDRTAVPPYRYPHLRAVANDMAPMLRASWLRGVSALPNSFAHESFIDELATAAQADPVDFRLRHLSDQRAIDLVRATAARAGWLAHTQPQQQARDGTRLKGQGFAYARYVHSKFPGFGAAWSAWVADVEVDKLTGEVHVSRVVVGHDAGTMINPAGVTHQIHGNVVQTTSRALKERVEIDPATQTVNAREWGSYPLLSFREVPVIEVLTMPRPGEPPLGAGESASVPGTAAIANAIFDATGVRFRQPPFTPEVVRAALNPLPAASPAEAQAPPLSTAPPRASVSADLPWPRRKGLWATALALGGAAITLGTALFGARPSMAPIARIDLSIYTPATLERGRQLAAIGNCVVCHTAPGGVPNAGGRRLETPFGAVISSNLTPDVDTGLGAWSFSAFARAMREGLSRDGHHLYPAFPYTSFAKTTDEDLMALYGHLMSQPAVRHEVAATQLAFPFSVRPMMALWNARSLDTRAVSDASRTPQWNRGAYLVNGLGHCGACHTPRDALGAELGGNATFSGAMVDGWEAPALTAASRAPVPWTEDEFFRYLRHGHTLQHGSVAGPMAPVVQQLASIDEADVRAMAHYLASFNPGTSALAPPQQVPLPSPAQRRFEASCGACHHAGNGPAVFGLNLPLTHYSSLHSDRPDNLLQVMLEGIREPATREIGFMPGFADALDDHQIAEIAAYLRQRYAPGQPAWADLPARVAGLRARAFSRR